MKSRTRWDERSSASLRKALMKAGFVGVEVRLEGDYVNAEFNIVDPPCRMEASKIGERFGLRPDGGGTLLPFGGELGRSDVSWKIRWRKGGKSR